MRDGRCLIGLAILLAVSVANARAVASPDTERAVRIPVRSSATDQPAFFLQAFVYRPSTGGRHPLLLWSHGSSGGDPKQQTPQPEQAGFFTKRGFVVIVPMRRGRGASGGRSLESEVRNCDPASWWPGLRTAYDDLTAAIDFAAAMPNVDPHRIVLAGESRGGFLSVAYAAEGARRRRVAGVVNFVGGWVAQAEDNCPTDFNQVAFRRFGAATRLPELWLYGDKDRFYSTASIRSYAGAYAAAGGNLAFDLIADVPDNGHWLPGFPSLWSEQVDEYLASRRILDRR